MMSDAAEEVPARRPSAIRAALRARWVALRP
jgi:hypothetical protein